MRFLSSRSPGIGMVEILVAGSLITVVLLGAMKMMKMSSDSAKRTDVKLASQVFEQRLRNYVSDAESCKTYVVDGLGQKVFDPAGLDAYNDDLTKSALAMPLADGVVKPNTTLPNGVKVGKFNLQILGVMQPAATGKFEGNLVIGMTGRDSENRALAGGDIRSRTIPLVLNTEADATEPTKRRIVGCFTKGNNGKEMCETIGGRWIESLTRCFFGGELHLAQFECVDKKEFEPGGALEGAVPTVCHYKASYSSAIMSRYTCYNLDVDRYYRCTCEDQRPGLIATKAGWGIRRPSDGSWYRGCEGGVTITTPDEATKMLPQNQYGLEKVDTVLPSSPTSSLPFVVGGAHGALTHAQWQKNWDILDSVTQCHFERGQTERSFRCTQAENALKAGVNSCVFVNHARVYDWPQLKYIDDYTGWIRVSIPRSITSVKVSGVGYNAVVNEAVGWTCSTVQVTDAGGSGRSEFITGLVDSAGVDILKDRANDVAECGFIGGLTSTTDYMPVAVRPFRGSYIQRLPCKNEEILIDDPAGEETKNPTLNRYHCWYVKNLLLPAAYRTVKGNTGGRYTGWVTLTSDLPDGWFWTEGTPHTEARPAPLISTGVSRQLNAIPCNLGVRLNQ